MMMLISVMNLSVFILYDVMTEPLLYSFIISIFFFIFLFAVDCAKEMKRIKAREIVKKTVPAIHSSGKWFCCILDQFISNAIKYTSSGTIEIKTDDNKLIVSDTGIGIMPEDLPLIFEKGYTGINGRIGQKSSGLGLYLAKKAADLIGIQISVESKAGEGSRFCICEVGADLNMTYRYHV